jgi:bacterioferritin (cytochrome b1)
MSPKPFLSDVETIRKRAREHIAEGREMVQYLSDTDPTSRRVMETILAVEEEHAVEMADLLEGLPEKMRK